MKLLTTIGLLLGTVIALQCSPIASNIQFLPSHSEIFDSLVENGIPARPGSFPHHVTILIVKNNSWILTSGVLIKEDWVLTVSAPIQNPQEIRIFHGSNRLNTKLAYGQKFVLHGRLALIQLLEPINIERFTVPALLPDDEIEENTDIILSGFGSKSKADSYSIG